MLPRRRNVVTARKGYFFIVFGSSLCLVALYFGIACGSDVPYSLLPPGGLDPENVPQFVVIGFDDNGYSGLEGSNGVGGMKWVLDFLRDKKNPGSSLNSGTFDGESCRVSFYLAGAYGDTGAFESSNLVKKAWCQAWLDGHEIGNHTFSHSGMLKRNTSVETWTDEIRRCNDFLTEICHQDNAGLPGSSEGGGIGLNERDIHGFRATFLAYAYETFTAIKNEGFLYDCSIEDGWQKEQDGTNFCWPYTLDKGSPGDNLIWNWPGVNRPRPIGTYPGLWELPPHPMVVPPDVECGRYNIPSGLRKKIKENYSRFDEASGKVPAFDFNLFFVLRLNREESLAVLKYTFDLHYNGNRAPFSIGAHSDIYSSKYPYNGPTDYNDRQWVLEQFVNYILAKPDVRIVPAFKVIGWCGNPRPIHREQEKSRGL